MNGSLINSGGGEESTMEGGTASQEGKGAKRKGKAEGLGLAPLSTLKSKEQRASIGLRKKMCHGEKEACEDSGDWTFI